MAIDLATLAALGILPSAASAVPGAIQDLSAPANQPTQAPNPLASLADNTNADANSTQKPSVGAPWKSDALLALGAGLLSGSNFFDGLAKGATAAQEARHAYENPKRNVLANGAFTLEQYPDGSTKLIPNKQIQDYQTLQSLIGFEGKAALQSQAAKAIADRMAASEKAQTDRTLAMIGAQDRRAAAQLQETQQYHAGDLKVREEAAAGKETPFQKGIDTAQGQEFTKLPDEINTEKDYNDQIDTLLSAVADKGSDGQWHLNKQKAMDNGIGLGVGMKASRGLARVLPGVASEMGFNTDKFSRVSQLLNRVVATATQQWLKKSGGGSRMAQYDLMLFKQAMPNFDMTPDAFMKAALDLKKENAQSLQENSQKLEEGKAKAAGQSAPVGGVTSAGIHWKPVD